MMSMLAHTGISIFAFIETEVDASIPDRVLDVDRYEVVRRDRTSKGGGVAVYFQDHLNFLVRGDLPEHNRELICIEIRPPLAKPFIILAWYRAPGEPVNCFVMLDNILSFIYKENKEIILIRDINCDFSREMTATNNNTKHFSDIYDLYSFLQKSRLEYP